MGWVRVCFAFFEKLSVEDEGGGIVPPRSSGEPLERTSQERSVHVNTLLRHEAPNPPEPPPNPTQKGLKN
eukprot:3819067-Amphidinium_carterae.1